MDTYRLKYFLAIAEEGSINRAATVLGIAQPALSRQLRLLEQELGVTLFRRTARGVQLTEDGEQLRATTTAPLRQLELAMQYAGSPLARMQRGLRIGLPRTAAEVLASPLLDSLSAAFPRADLHLSVGSTAELVEAMLKAAVDIAVIEPVPDDRLFYGELLSEDLAVVGSPDSGLEPTQPVSFAGLCTRPLILGDEHSGIRKTLENTALRLKLTLNPRYSTDSVHLTKDLVRQGRGYAVLPRSACTREIASGALRHAPIIEPTLTQQIGTATTSQLNLPRGFAIKVSEIIRDEVTGLVRSGLWPATLPPPG